MGERIVRYTEPEGESTQTDSIPVLPAPMVERAFRLLDLLSSTEDGLTLSDMARALHMSKGSIHGLLKTLEYIGAIEQEEDRRFVPGPRLYDLAQAYIQRAGLRHFALPAMHLLATRTGGTVCLGKVEPKGVRIVECIVDEASATLHIAARRGLRVPLLAAATGCCVLASWPQAQRESFLHDHPLPAFTQHSVTDVQQFLARVDETVLTGLGFDYEEYLHGVNAIATPLYGVGNTLIALLWIIGFSSQLRDEALQQAALLLLQEGKAISHALGART